MAVVQRLIALFPVRLFRFGLVGLTAATTDFSVFNVLLAVLGTSTMHVLVANTIGFAAAACVGYLLNSRYTFGAARTRASFARYIAVALVGVAIYDTGLYLLLTRLGAGSVLMANVAKVAAIAPSATWNFIGFSLFAFPRSSEAASRREALAEGGDGRR